jgi:hypothetical protein
MKMGRPGEREKRRGKKEGRPMRACVYLLVMNYTTRLIHYLFTLFVCEHTQVSPPAHHAHMYGFRCMNVRVCTRAHVHK